MAHARVEAKIDVDLSSTLACKLQRSAQFLAEPRAFPCDKAGKKAGCVRRSWREVW